MKDVMLDFETLGVSTEAVVCQIGACYFDKNTGEIGEKFKVNVDAIDAVKSGAIINPDTVYWWLDQSKEAQNSILAHPRKPIREAFEELNTFLSKAEAIWSHATFDYVILQQTMRRLDIKTKYHYRTARDIRTLVSLAHLSAKKEATREGVHHDALDDCIYQVKYCVMALNKLKGKV